MAGYTRTVRKYAVLVDDKDHTFDIPGLRGRDSEGLNVLGVEPHGYDEVNFWCEVVPDLSSEPITLRVFGTGQPIPDNYVHRGTVKVPGAPLVWHLYEKLGA